MGALGSEDFLQDRVGVLGLVEEEEVGVDDRLFQRPHLQVVVVFEPDHSVFGMA